MKKLTLITLFFLSVFIQNGSAAIKNKIVSNNYQIMNFDDLRYDKTTVDNYINLSVDYPQEAVENNIEGFVLVELQVNSLGYLDILNVNANDEFLKQHVVNKLTQINLRPEESQNSVHLCKFVFDIV